MLRSLTRSVASVTVCRRLAVATIAAWLSLASVVQAASYYWFGDNNNFWNQIVGPGGTNWSSSGDFNNGTAGATALPGSNDDVFFVLAGANNLTTELGANFSIRSLTFTADAQSPVQINDTPGTNTLTIGAGGITNNGPSTYTINAAVAVGAAETWANNGPAANPLTFGGVISGSSALTLQGTGSTLNPTGSFLFSGNNSYTGALTLLNANTSLTLSGGGTLRSASGITLGGGSFLNLDDSTTNAVRLNSAMPILSNGGTISLIGNSSVNSADGFGTLSLSTGTTRVNVTAGGAQTATLTIGSIGRSRGSSINFAPTSSTSVVALTNSSLATGILGSWATIGDLTGAGSLDWATVSGGTVVPYSAYNTSTTPAAWAGTNVQANSLLTVNSATPNTLYLTGGAVLSGNGAANTITIGSGGVIANGGTGSFTFSGGVAATGVVDLGSSVIGNSTGSFLTAGFTVPDLVFNVAGSYSNPNNPTAANNGVLEIAGNIKDAPLTGTTFTASTTSGSNAVTLTAGTTAQLFVGAHMTLTGFTGLQTITSITDGTHFQVGTNATATGSATPTFTSSLGLTKNGGGILDLSNFNSTTTAYSFTGPVTINGGVVVVKADGQLGAAPAANTPSSIVLNGGDLRMVGTITIANTRGMFLGPQGGQLSYTGGNTTHLSSFQMTGPGSIEFNDIPQWHSGANNSAAMSLEYVAGSMTYTGATTFFTQAADNYAPTQPSNSTVGAVIFFTNDNEVPALSPVTVTNVLNANQTFSGVVNMNGHSATWGSLAGNGDIVTDSTALQTLTVGGNNFSTIYTGNLGHSGLSWVIGGNIGSGDNSAKGNVVGGVSGTNIALTKVGNGTMTLGGANQYTGATTINGGALLVGNGTAQTDSVASLANTAVTVGNGALIGSLGGNGTINGTVRVTSTGHLAPAMTSSTFNTLTINNNLTINAGGALDFNFASPGASPNGGTGIGDLVNVTGTGNVSLAAGADILNVTQLAASGFGLGTYPLITVAGSGTLTDAATFTVNGKPNFNYAVLKPGDAIDPSLGGGNVPVGQLWLEVLQGNPNLTWIGNVNNLWDVGTTANWAGDNTIFTTGSNVTFDDFATGGHNNPVSVVAGGVNPNSITFNGTGAGASGQDFTFTGGPITVNTSVVKNQAGSVTFNNNVTTPITTVASGSFNIGSTSTYNSSVKFDLNGGSVLVNGALNTPALTVKTGGNLTVSASGQLGTATLVNNSDTVVFNQAAQTLAGIGGAGSLTLNGTALMLTGASSYSGAINGTGSLRVSGGSADVMLSGNNGYSGGTTVAAGFLRAGSLTAFGSNPSLTVQPGGTLDINGIALAGSVYTNVMVGGEGVGGAGAIINTGGGQENALLGVTLTADTKFGGTSRWVIRGTATTTATVNGGGFDLSKVGPNTVGLATTNALVTGVRNINIIQGTLVVADTSTVDNSVPGSIILNSTGALSIGNYASPTGVVINKPLVMSGGSLRTDSTGTNGNATVAAPISLNSTGMVNPQSGSTLTLNGSITNGTSSISGMTYGGAGTVVLGTASTYGGPTTIAGATVRTSSVDNTLPATTSLAVNAGALDLAGHNQQIPSLSGLAGGTITNSVAATNSTITVNGSSSTVYAGTIQNGAGSVSLVQAGTGTLTLSGLNSFNGTTTVSSGVLVSANSAALGTSTVTLNGGTLQASPLGGAPLAGFGDTSTSVNGAGTGWTVNNTAIASNPINSNVLTLTDGGGGEARSAYYNAAQPFAAGSKGFNASFTYTPSAADLTTAADGVVFMLQRDTRGLAAIGGTGGGFAYTSENGTAVQPSVAIALNIYNGHVIGTNLITNGNPGNPADTYLPTGNVNLASGDPIGVAISYDPVAGQITETLTDTTASTTFTQVYSGVNLAATIGSNLAFVGFGGGTGGNTATQTISNFNYSVTGGGAYSNNAILNGSTTSSIDVAATATASTVTMGTLSVGAGTGTTLNVTATTAPTDQSFGLTFGATALSGNVTFNVANNGAGTGTLTLGAVTDGGSNSSITKTGPGTLALTAGGTYGGGTSINGGTLRITNATNSATGTGAVTMVAGTTLSGTGAISGPLSLAGHLSPGVGVGGVGTLTLGSTSLGTGSILDYDVGGLSFDSAHAGALTLGTALTVNINTLAGFGVGTYNLVTSTGITGSPTFTVNHTGPNFNYSVAEQGNNIVLIVSAQDQKWTGAIDNQWDTTTANWNSAVNGGVYQDNAYQQVFDDSGANTNISIAAPVSPIAVRFANNTVPYTISGSSITGSAAVTIQGLGAVTLSSPNSYTGGTNLLAGTLNLGDPAAIGTGSLLVVGGTLDNTSGGPMALANNNTQVWAGNFTFTGTSDLNLGTGNVTLMTTPTVTVTAGTLTVGGAIGDGGAGYGLTKDGPGTLTLGGANTYSGSTVLLNGNVNVVGSGTLGGGASPLTVSTSGTLDLGGTVQPVGATLVTAGTVRNGTLNASSYTINNSADVVISANLAGGSANGLAKSGPGTATLSGTNSYAGGTSITAGVLSISSDANLGAVPAAVQPANIALNGGTLQITAATTISTNRGITVGASNGTINVPFAASGVIDSGTSGTPPATIGYVKYSGVTSGAGGLTVTGGTGVNDPNGAPYLLVLNGQANTYAGPTVIDNATVTNDSAVTGGNMLPATTVLTLQNNGVYAYWGNNNNATTQTLGGLVGDATGQIGTENNGTVTTLTINTVTGASYQFDGLIQDVAVLGRGTAGTGGAVINVIKNGAGTQIFGGGNLYKGDTTVNAGTLTTTATGAIGNGTGGLIVNNSDGTSSVVNLGNNQAISELSGTITGTGSARVNVPAGVTLTDSQATNTTFAGTLALGAGATTSGGTFAMNGNAQSTLEIQGAPSLGNNSNINLNGTYTLRFNVTAGSPVVGTGVQANVQDGATLELAGSVSALSQTSGGRVSVANNSNATVGLHVTGTNQQVGAVDGSGTTQVDAGASLTANHIVQGALVIGGTAGSPALVTIAASDANGNSLATSGGLAVAGSIASGGSGSTLISSSVSASSSPASGGLTAASGLGSATAASGVNLAGGNAAVPEPSTLVIALVAVASLGCLIRRKKS